MKKLDVLLIKPYMMTDEIQPPLGLGYLATAIRDRHNVKIIDGIKNKLTIQKFEEELKEIKYDIIGIQCYTFDIEITRELIKCTRKILPNAVIIVGGPHPSGDPFSVYNYLGADFGFKGEAEIGFGMLVSKIAGKNMSLDKIPGLIWKKGHKVIINRQMFIEDLDKLKHPSWDLLRPDSYPCAPHGAFFKSYPTAPIFATRGCPFQCTFCAGFNISGRKIRYRSIQGFVDEIEMLHKIYGINEIHIEDDNFSLNKKFATDFCKELLKRKLGITWVCPNGLRLDTLDPEILKLMKTSGLYAVSVGIESGSDKILKDMKKNLTKEQIRQKVQMISDAGLDVVGFFILGYPTETVDTIKETIKFACELPLKRASFMAFKPFPGTEATNSIAEGNSNYGENFALNKIVYAPPGITQKKLKMLRQIALIKFYFRPKIMYSLFCGLRSIGHFKFVFKRAFRWVFT